MNMAIPSNYNYNTRPTQAIPTSPVPVSPQAQKTPSLQKVKNATPKKDNKKPWLLWGSLLAGAVLLGTASVLSFKAYHQIEAMKQIPKNLEHVFGRSYSKEESLQAVKTYQDLLKIEDQNTFIEKAFHQVKKDFGYEDLSLKLDIVDKPIEQKGDALKGAGGLLEDTVTIYKQKNREDILNTIAHELNHLRQYEYMSRADLLESSFYEGWFNKLKHRSKENPKDVKDVRESAQEIRELYEELFKPLKRPKIKTNTPDYQKVFAYAESAKEHANQSKEVYQKNWFEQDACQVGTAMKEFIETIQINGIELLPDIFNKMP